MNSTVNAVARLNILGEVDSICVPPAIMINALPATRIDTSYGLSNYGYGGYRGGTNNSTHELRASQST